jgi:voltage-gated potassium channel
VADYLDIVSTAGGPELRFEEIEVKEECPSCGRSIRELRVRDATGAMVIAIRKRDGRFDTTPSPDAVLEHGDVLIGVGTQEEIGRLEDMFAPGASVGG